MTFSSFWYLTKRGLKSMVANRMMTLASIGIVTACLFVTGAATLLSANLNSYADYLVGTSETVVFLWDSREQKQVEETLAAGGELPDVTTDTPYDAQAIQQQIQALPNVASAELISKDAALDEMSTLLGEGYEGLLEDYRDGTRPNPFPVKLYLKLHDLRQVENTRNEILAIDGVQQVNSPNELAVALINVKDGVNYAGWGLVVILGFVGLVIIANTIRLTVFARHKEINIMKFVGATNAFIRLPFFVEGIAVGLISAVLAFGLLSGGYILLLDSLKVEMASGGWLSNILGCMIPYTLVWPYMLGGFCLAGAGLGGLGSAFSVRKHLKV